MLGHFYILFNDRIIKERRDIICTAIQIDYKDGAVVGRNMDLEVDVDFNILFLPRGYQFGEDLLGRPLYTKYKAMGICFRNTDPIKDGINEYGLIGVTNEFAGFNRHGNKIKEDKINIRSLDFLNYALTQYKSVEELIDNLENLNFSKKDIYGNLAITPDFHHFFSDPTGRSIVVEPENKEIHYYENPYKVMTNSPGLPRHIKRLEKLLDGKTLEEFNSSKNLPGGYDPVSRFIRAYYMREKSFDFDNLEDALGQAHHILGALSIPEGTIYNNQFSSYTYTLYQSVFDTKSKSMSIRTAYNPMIYSINLEDFNSDKREYIFLDKKFDSKSIKSV